MFRMLTLLLCWMVFFSCQQTDPKNALYAIQQSHFNDGIWHSETREVQWVKAWTRGDPPPSPPSFNEFSLVKADLIAGIPDSLISSQRATVLVEQFDHPSVRLGLSNNQAPEILTYYFSYPAMSEDGRWILLIWEAVDIHGGLTYVGLFEKQQGWQMCWKQKISEWIE